MAEQFVIRDENFGATLFDRKALRYKYLTHQELNRDIAINNTRVENFEHWTADLKDSPKDLLYSPIRIYFETTRVCNLSCTHCFNASGKAAKDEMDTESMLMTLSGLRTDNVLDVRFTGGEFTRRPDWFLILAKAKSLGFAVSVNTNGVYDDPSVIEKLASLNLEQITISIDGKRENHDLIRGQGSFDKSIESLKQLKEKGGILRTNTVLTKLSLEDMQEIIDTVYPFVDEMNFFHMRWTGRAKRMSANALDYDELATFNLKAAEISRNYPAVNIMYGSQVTRENSLRLNELGLRMGGPDGFTRFNLLANGTMWPGGYVPYIDKSLNLGNIQDQGFSVLDTWRNSEKLNQFRNFSKSLIERCFTCSELTTRCGGTNVEMELIRNKNPKAGNPYCIY